MQDPLQPPISSLSLARSSKPRIVAGSCSQTCIVSLVPSCRPPASPTSTLSTLSYSFEALGYGSPWRRHLRQPPGASPRLIILRWRIQIQQTKRKARQTTRGGGNDAGDRRSGRQQTRPLQPVPAWGWTTPLRAMPESPWQKGIFIWYLTTGGWKIEHSVHLEGVLILVHEVLGRHG